MGDDRSIQWSRREWIQLAGAGAGLGVLIGDRLNAVTLAAAQSGARRVTFPRGAIIRTLVRDLPPDGIGSGATLFHEHLSINLAAGGRGAGGQRGAAPPPSQGVVAPQGVPPPVQGSVAPPAQGGAVPPAQGGGAQASQPAPGAARGGGRGGPPLPPVTDDVDMVVQLMNKAASEGVGCIVDGGHADMGTKLADLKTIAGRTKVHIVASGGFYMGRNYPADIATKTEDQIADDLVREARAGRFGAFGEIGVNPNTAELSLEERKVFRAVGKASVRTGIPIFTHNSYGTGMNVPRGIGLQQLDILESVGVRPEHIVIGHTCCLDDPEVTLISEIAKRGAFVGFDRVTTVQQFMPDEKKVAMVVAFLAAGHADKLLLSADFTGQRTLEGGPGYGRTLTVFAPLLRKAGVSEDMLRMILYDNPRRFLAFVPKRV